MYPNRQCGAWEVHDSRDCEPCPFSKPGDAKCVEAYCSFEDTSSHRQLTDFKNMIGDELRAVGITPDGALLPVRSADSMRGVLLSGLVVSIRHRAWFKENEEALRLSFPDPGGQVVIFGDTGSIAEVF